MRSNGSLWRSLLLLLVGSAAVGALAGCGGGAGAGGGGGTTTTTTTTTTTSAPSGGTTTTAGSIQLTVSSTNLQSSGVTPIDITVRVLSTTGVVIAGKCVTFTITDVAPVSFVTDVSNGGVTDTNGIVTARLNLGPNKANRTITLTANAVDCTSGAIEALSTTTITVVGTTATATGNPSVTFGGTTTVTVTVRDAAGTAIPGATVTLGSAAGNTLTPSTGTTNSLGQFTTTVTGTAAGADVISVSVLGATTTFALTVSSTNFRFTAPAEGAEIPVGAATAVTARWEEAGVAVPASLVRFAVTRGCIAAAAVPLPVPPCATTVTVATVAGDATVFVSSPESGPVTVTAADAADGSPAATRNLLFVTTTATRVDVQANPSVIPVNVVGSSANTATISAVVRDAANNLVKNARVNFAITRDPTGGSLSAPSAVTDVSGVASVTYIAGTLTCCGPAPFGVEIGATVTEIIGVPGVLALTDSVTVTVGSQPLFVRLGTNNLLGATDLTYIKRYVALVTDAAGNPVNGARVRFTVRPRRATSATAFAFFKGIRVFCLQDTGLPLTVAVPNNPPQCGSTFPGGPFVVTTTGWIAVVNVRCLNEDTNFNGIWDSPTPGVAGTGEDANGDAELTPGNVASVTPEALTDAAGFATAEITYAKQYGDWTVVTLTATAAVAGTEASQSATFVLPVLRSDVDDAGDAPPGVTDPVTGQIRSPFGRGIIPGTTIPEAQPADGICTTTN